MTAPPPALRIAFLLPSFPELSNTFILTQITGLLDRGHEVLLFAVAQNSFADAHPDVTRYALAERMLHLPIPVGRVARLRSALALMASAEGRRRAALDALNPWRHGRRSLNLVHYHTVVSFLRAPHFDVLHCQFGDYGPASERLLRLASNDVALVTSFRGADLTLGLEREPRRFADLLRNGDMFLPVSDDFGRRLVAAGAPADRVITHRSGLALERFAFAQRRPQDGPPRLLFVGRLTEKKGVAYLLEALAMVLASGRDARLSIVGSGRLESALRSRCQSLGLTDRVQFCGPLPHTEVIRAMERSHVVVAPSITGTDGDQEGIPNVLKEAMAVGLPVVATRHSGIPELVEDGVSGFLAAERDAEDLGRCLTTVLDNPQRWPEWGRAGRRRVEAEYDAQRLNDELVRLYRRAIVERAGRRPSVRTPLEAPTDRIES